jgi:hypothetical protein
MNSMKNHRRNRSLKYETLENRELMAADVTAYMSGSTLMIEGTNGNDHVVVELISNGRTRVMSGNRVVADVPTSYNAMDAKMLDGKDHLRIYAGIHNSLERVAVDMGRGANEYMNLQIGATRNLNVNTASSVSTHVALTANVLDQAIVDFGNDAGNDGLVTSNSSFNALKVRMGSGNDSVTMYSTSVQRADVKLGAGRDSVAIDFYSDIASGTLDGGDGDRDSFKKRGSRLSGGSIRGFEIR